MNRQNNHQRTVAYNKFPQYSKEDNMSSYGNSRSNFLKYQDSVAKDEYWKVGQNKEPSSAIYDSMQFLSMKREKSMYNNDESSSYLKREKSNPMLKNQTKDPQYYRNLNGLETKSYERINLKSNNNFNAKTFLAMNKKNKNHEQLNEDISMQNLLWDSFDDHSKQGSPDSINSMYDQRSKKIEHVINRQ